MPGPLSGVRVLDISAVVVGPACTRVLADQGADVIKVEPPGGDSLRDLDLGRSPGMPSRFINLNRNKRGIALDLKAPAGAAVFRRLLASSDVLVTNMRPSALERLKLDYATLAVDFPHLVHCLILAFGRGGPYYDQPAYDPIVQALSGMAGTFEPADGAPRFVPMTLVDQITGLIAAQCICAALYRREKRGRGESVEVPMFENAASFVMTEHMGGAIFEPPMGAVGNEKILSPDNRPLKTADSYIAVSVLTDRQVAGFFDAIGRPELTADPRFNSGPARARNVGALNRIRHEALTRRTTEDWLEIFRRADIPAARYNSLDDVIVDPHLAAVGFFHIEDHPTEGRLRRTMPANRFGGDEGATPYLPVPILGANTREILAETGLAPGEIDKLIDEGVAIQA